MGDVRFYNDDTGELDFRVTPGDSDTVEFIFYPDQKDVEYAFSINKHESKLLYTYLGRLLGEENLNE